MAIQELLNGEARLSFREKLNTMFTEVYNYITTTGVSVASINTSITTLDTAVTDLTTTTGTLTTDLSNLTTTVTTLSSTGATSVVASTALTPVTVTTTPAQLTYFNSVGLQAGSYTTASIPAQTITINANGYYKIYGGIVTEFAQTEQITLRLYKNGAPLTPSFSQQGLGTGKPIIINYSTIVQLTAGDVLTIYASTTASTSVTVTGASVNFEKTHY